MATLSESCKNCGHDQSKHKGIDPALRFESRCTGLQVNAFASSELGRTVAGPLRCDCSAYITDEMIPEQGVPGA